jgi:hypothetical protein
VNNQNAEFDRIRGNPAPALLVAALRGPSLWRMLIMSPERASFFKQGLTTPEDVTV